MDDSMINIGYGLDRLKREYKNMFPFHMVKEYTDKIQAVIDKLEADYDEEYGYKQDLPSALESIEGICEIEVLEDEWSFKHTGYRLCNKYDIVTACAELNNNPAQFKCTHIYVMFYIVCYRDIEYKTKPNIHYAPVLDKALLLLHYDTPDPDYEPPYEPEMTLEECIALEKSKKRKRKIKVRYVDIAHFVCMIKPQTGEVLKWIHVAYY